VLDTRPPAVEYRLTSRGKRFEPLLRELVRCGRACTHGSRRRDGSRRV
jgi:DNA-binding HxlR family transcriptional regulator